MTIRKKDQLVPTAWILAGLCSLAGLSMAATPLDAQENGLEKGSQLVSVFYGPFFGLSGDGEDEDDSSSEAIEFESDWAIGGSYQYFLTSRLSIEANISFGRGESELEVFGDESEQDESTENDDNEDSDNGNGDTDDESDDGSGNALYATGNLVYHFRPQARLRPYVLAGAGLVRIDVESQATSRPAGVFGGGVLIGLSKSISVRVDARDYLYTLDQGGGSSTINDLSLTGGISFAF